MGVAAQRGPELFAYGPQVSFGELLSSTPYRLAQNRRNVEVGTLIRAELYERRVIHMRVPAVTFQPIDVFRRIDLMQLMEVVNRHWYPNKIERPGDMHLPRIFEMVDRRDKFEDPQQLLSLRWRHIFPFTEFVAVLIHSSEHEEKEWELDKIAWEDFALKRHDRVFFKKADLAEP